MVEEFMLLANIYTAEKTRIEFPLSAVLRRHPSPPDTNFRPLIKVAENKVVCCAPILLHFMIFSGVSNTSVFFNNNAIYNNNSNNTR